MSARISFWIIKSHFFVFLQSLFLLMPPPNWVKPQIRNKFRNFIFIAYKWLKICKYYNKKAWLYQVAPKGRQKNACWFNIWFTLFGCNIKYVVIYAFFPPNLYSQIKEFTKNSFFPSLPYHKWTYFYYLVNTFTDLKDLFEFVVKHFIHKDT